MIRVLGLAVVLLAATMAQAATVEMKLNLDQAAGTWQVIATSSPASIISAVYANDNAGIAGFTINMKDVSTATMAGPKGFDFAAGMITRGFILQGTTFDASTSEYEILGGQSTIDPNTLLYGIGQSAGAIIGLPPQIPNTPYDNPVVLASGTFAAGKTPTIVSGSANVFTATGAVTASAATVVIVPEPVTLTLLGVGALALLRRRR
jgi:hypothetical protein